MKVYFDLSVLERSQMKNHREAWESALANFSGGEADDQIVCDPSSADVIIYTSSRGFYDAPLLSMLKPLTSREVKRLVWDWGDAPLGRSSGFYCSLNQALFDHNRHRSAPYPVTFNELVDFASPDDATYDFGFVGGITAGVRQRIFETLGSGQTRHNALIRAQSTDWSSIFDRSGLSNKRDYAESLARMRFVLCPRGAGVGSVRLFETMKAGRVPIIISDGYVFPAGVDWARCSIKVRENDIASIPGLVAAILPQWPGMAAEARRAWTKNFSDATIFPYMMTQLRSILRSLPRVDNPYRLRYATAVSTALVARYARPLLGRAKGILRHRRLERMRGSV